MCDSSLWEMDHPYMAPAMLLTKPTALGLVSITFQPLHKTSFCRA